MFAKGQPAAMFFTEDINGDFERMKSAGAEFAMTPANVQYATIAKVNDGCGNLIQITQLARW